MGQCNAKTKDGLPCKNPTTEGSRYCHIHSKRIKWIYIPLGAFLLGGLGFFANVFGVLDYFGISPKNINNNNSYTITSIPTEYPSGVDIQNNCISTLNWRPYAQSQDYFEKIPTPLAPPHQEKCWYLYDWGIYNQNEELYFMGEDVNEENYGLYGISTKVSADSIINFDMSINKFPSSGIGSLKFAIISNEIPTFTSNTVFLECWYGSGLGHYLYLYDVKNGEKTLVGYKGISIYDNTFNIKFIIESARLTVLVNEEQLNNSPVNIPYSSLNFWLGYEIDASDKRLEAHIKNLLIQTK